MGPAPQGSAAFNLWDEHFAIVEPGGNAVAGDYDGLLDGKSLNLGLSPGQSGQGWVRFTVEKTSGNFVLRLKSEGATGEAPIAVP